MIRTERKRGWWGKWKVSEPWCWVCALENLRGSKM